MADDRLIAPRNADLIRISDGEVRFLGADGIAGFAHRDAGGQLDIALSASPPAKALRDAVDESQKDLVENVSKALRTTMGRIGRSFNWHLRMNVLLFAVGIGSFVIAAYKGLANPGQADAIVAAAFGGLTAASFIGYFLSRPTAAVAGAGPEAAWLLGTVNTYWSKLIYLNNPATFVDDIEKAQQAFEASMKVYFETVNYQGRVAALEEKSVPKPESESKPESAQKGESHGREDGAAADALQSDVGEREGGGGLRLRRRRGRR